MKKTGKALSLVLSLALVVSSIPATFASAAATRTEYVGDLGTDTSTTLVTGPTSIKTDLSTLVGDATGTTTRDYLSVMNMKPVEVVHESGSSLVKTDFHSDTQKLGVYLNDANAVGTETLAVRYTKTSYRYTDATQPILFTAVKHIQITVVKPGVATLSLGNISKNGTTMSGKVSSYKATQPDGTKTDASLLGVEDDGYNVWTDKNVVTGYTDNTTPAAAQGDYYVSLQFAASNKAALSSTGTDNKFTVNLTKADTLDYLNVGSVIAYAQKVKTAATRAGSTSKADATYETGYVPVTAKINNCVDLGSYDYISTWHGATWAASTSTGWADENKPGNPDVKGGVNKPVANALNVTGCDINLGADTTMSKGIVGAVNGNGYAKSFNMTDAAGVVSSISKAKNVTITNGTVTGNVGAIEVTVNGGKTGNITADSVTVDALDPKVVAQTGTIEATTIGINSDKKAVTTGSITKDGTAGPVEVGPNDDTAHAITLSGAPTVGAIDLGYLKTKLDLVSFTGTIAAPKNAGSSVIATDGTDTAHTNATLTGAVAFDTINVNDGTLTIATSAAANVVSGAGTLVIPAGALTVNTVINGISLKLSNGTFGDGTTVLNVPPYVAYAGAFTTVGFDLDYDAVNNSGKTGLLPMKIKTSGVHFASLTIAPVKGSMDNTIAEGNTVTYKASAYPSGQAIPTGDKIQFDFSGSGDNFTYDSTKNTDDTITIQAVKYDSIFNSMNKGTITATLVNKDTGIQDYNFPTAATYDINLVQKSKFTSDTTGTFNTKVGATYTFKISSSDGSDPSFGFGTSGVANIVKNSKSGNDYFYTVQGLKEGGTGVFVGGSTTPVCVIVVKGLAYTSDTTAVTVASGKSYQFLITADANAVAPTFQVNGFSAANTQLVKKDGNKYYFKITNSNVGAGIHGAYVNGMKVATVTVK